MRDMPLSRLREARRQVRAEVVGSALESLARTRPQERAREPDDRLALADTVRGYTREIETRFDPRLYSLVIRALPWALNWLLNAARDRRFLPGQLENHLPSRVRIEGATDALESLVEKGTVLLLPTHQSHLDILVVGYALHLLALPAFAWGAGLNLFANPLLGFGLRRAGAYTVDRENASPAYRATLAAYSKEIVKRGVHSVFFPGGGRSRSGAIESRLKLGLIGSALEAHREMLREGRPRPDVFVVPAALSYPFVFEAPAMIASHLAKQGLASQNGAAAPTWRGVLPFLWRGAAANATATLRFGAPRHILGHRVDGAGRPLESVAAPCAGRGDDTHSSRPHLEALAAQIAAEFRRANTVLCTHAVAFALFEVLRKRFPNATLAELLRLSPEQRSIAVEAFLSESDETARRLLDLAQRREIELSPEMSGRGESWQERGLRLLAAVHRPALVDAKENRIELGDLALLYYYRNRLSGYGLSTLGTDDPIEYESRPAALGRNRGVS